MSATANLSQRTIFAAATILSGSLLSACVSAPETETRPYKYTTQPRFVDVAGQSGLDAPQLHVEGVIDPADPKNRELRCATVNQKIIDDLNYSNVPAITLTVSIACEADASTGGAATVDMVGSPLPDIILTRLGAHPLLYENLGNFTFRDVSEAAGFDKVTADTNGVAVADIDNDGDLDVFFTVLYAKSAVLLVNQGDGTFKDETEARGATLANGQMQFGTGATFADYDNDGWVDLHTNEWYPAGMAAPMESSHSRLLRNLGASGRPGHFEDVTEKAGVSIERPNLPVFSFSSLFHDFDGDGNLDLVVVSDFGLTEYFWSNGDGTFTRKNMTTRFEDQNGMGVALGDTDGDGTAELYITAIYTNTYVRPDQLALAHCDPASELIDVELIPSRLATSGWSGSRLFKHVGNRIFVDRSNVAGVRAVAWGWGASFGDFRNTGNLDLIAVGGMYGRSSSSTDQDACYLEEPPKLWINDGFGHFVDVAAQSGMGSPLTAKGVAVFDADGDGRMDVLITRDYDTPILFKNETKTSNGFIKIKVLNEHGVPTSGIKVEITMEVGGRTITRWTGPTGAYLTVSEPILHVGIGSASSVAKVLVHYKNGAQILENLDAGGTYETRP